MQCSISKHHGLKHMSDNTTPISGLHLNDIDSVRRALDELSKKGSDSPFIPLFEARLLLEAGDFSEAGKRFLAVVSNNELDHRVYQLSLRLIGLITDDQNFLNILLKIRERVADQIIKQEQAQTVSQTLDALGYVQQNTTKRLRLLSEHFVSMLANRAYDLLLVDTAFFFEQKIYQIFITKCETEEAFNFGMTLTRDSATQAGMRVKDKLGDKKFDFANVKPTIGFVFHNASMLAHISNVHGYLSSAYEKGYPDFVPILFCLGGRNDEFEEAYSKIDVKIIYLDVDLNDSTKKINSVATRLIQLRTICEQLKVDKIVWGCLASFMPFAFNMRLAKEQIWWSQKWQHFTFSGLDKRIYSFNKNMLQNHYGQPWYCGWFQKKSWLEPIDAEDVRSLRQQFAGKVILGSLCRSEKMHDAAFLNTVSQLLLDNDNVIYLWAGREQDPAIQQHFTDAGVSQKTRYIGWVNTSLFASVFDIFLDSFPAGSGITAIQAMQAGKPVVTHRCTDNVKSLDNLFTSFFGNQQNTEFLGCDAMHKNDVSCKDQASPFTFAEDQNEYRMIVQNLINDCELREKVGNNYKNFVTENFCSPEMAERRFTDCLLIEV